MRNESAKFSAIKEAPEEYGAASLPEDTEAMQHFIQEVFDILGRKYTNTEPKPPAVVLEFKRPIPAKRPPRTLR